jgi:hypothetical protein
VGDILEVAFVDPLPLKDRSSLSAALQLCSPLVWSVSVLFEGDTMPSHSRAEHMSVHGPALVNAVRWQAFRPWSGTLCIEHIRIDIGPS